MSRRQRHVGYRIAIAGLLFISALTLMPQPEESARAAATPITCILCGDLGSVDFLLNILLFIPLGLGLALAGFSSRRTIVLAGLLTCLIELTQMKLIPGRDASLGDVLANSLGGGLGALLAAHWRQLVFPETSRSRRLALSCALALAWVWGGTAWALGPAYPEGGRWFGAWAPELGNFAKFTGTPLTVLAGGEPLLPGPAIDQQRLEDAVAARPAIELRAVIDAPPDGLAPIGLVVDDPLGEVILLGQDRQDLAFRLRMRASIVRLRVPMASLDGGMEGQRGDTVDAQGALNAGAFELNSRVGGHVLSRRLPLSASWGWSLITPWDSALGPEVHFLTALWIVGLIAVLAYWSVLAGEAALAIVPAATMFLLGVVPYVAGFPPAHWSEWAAALVGIGLGLAAARRALRTRASASTAEIEYLSTTPSEATV